MAQYQHLPIYKLTYDILLRIMQVTKDFPREYKYTLGQNFKDETTELIVLIYRANSTKDKIRHIDEIIERVQLVQLLMRLCHDMRILQRKHYADLTEKTDSLARQAQGWRKASKKNSGKDEPERKVA